MVCQCQVSGLALWTGDAGWCGSSAQRLACDGSLPSGSALFSYEEHFIMKRKPLTLGLVAGGASGLQSLPGCVVFQRVATEARTQGSGEL